MRAFAFIPLLILAACGENAAENKAAPAASALQPGQWDVASEVTEFRVVGGGAARIDTPVGTRATASVCVGEDERVPTELFAGEGYRCTYGSLYLRRGRMNVTLNCRREGLTGTIAMTALGTFQAESFEGQRDLTTTLSTDGDVAISARLTGRRTGECAAEGAAAGNAQ